MRKPSLRLPRWLSGKEPTVNAGDAGSIPGSGRCPGEGNAHPLQDSFLENPIDRGDWRATGSHGVGHDWSDWEYGYRDLVTPVWPHSCCPTMLTQCGPFRCHLSHNAPAKSPVASVSSELPAVSPPRCWDCVISHLSARVVSYLTTGHFLVLSPYWVVTSRKAEAASDLLLVFPQPLIPHLPS